MSIHTLRGGQMGHADGTMWFGLGVNIQEAGRGGLSEQTCPRRCCVHALEQRWLHESYVSDARAVTVGARQPEARLGKEEEQEETEEKKRPLAGTIAAQQRKSACTPSG